MIIAVTPGSLSSKDKEKLTKKGYVVIEMADPDSIRFIEPDFETNDYYMAALSALNRASNIDCSRFVEDIYNRLKKKEAAKENKTE